MDRFLTYNRSTAEEKEMTREKKAGKEERYQVALDVLIRIG
jgi:hypothetical protein